MNKHIFIHLYVCYIECVYNVEFIHYEAHSINLFLL